MHVKVSITIRIKHSITLYVTAVSFLKSLTVVWYDAGTEYEADVQ